MKKKAKTRQQKKFTSNRLQHTRKDLRVRDFVRPKFPFNNQRFGKERVLGALGERDCEWSGYQNSSSHSNHSSACKMQTTDIKKKAIRKAQETIKCGTICSASFYE